MNQPTARSIAKDIMWGDELKAEDTEITVR
jgi:hypothetical protein